MINRDLLIINLKKSLRKLNIEEILKIIVIKFFIDKIEYLKDKISEELLKFLIEKWIKNFSINVLKFRKVTDYDYIYAKYDFDDRTLYYNISNKYLEISDFELSKSEKNDLVINEFKIMVYKEIENIINITLSNNKIISNGFYIENQHRYPEYGGDFSDIIDIFSENEVCEILKLDSKFKKYISDKYYIYQSHISKRNAEVIGYIAILKQIIGIEEYYRLLSNPNNYFEKFLKQFNGKYRYVLNNYDFLLKNQDTFSLIENYILHIRNKINSDKNLQYHIELSKLFEIINKKVNIENINIYLLNK
jgi:hypothetical protein